MRKILAILVIGLVVVTTGCNNNENVEPIPLKQLTLSKLIGRWQMTKLTLTDISGGINERRPCESDNIFEFKEKNELTIDLQNRCNDNGDYWGFTYEYQVSEDGDSYDMLYDGNLIEQFDIDKLEGNDFILKWQEINGRFTYDYTAYFERI